MGTFRVPIEIGDASGTHFIALQALVDTGATYTQVPASILHELGIVPHLRRAFTLANGQSVPLDIGRAWVRINGSQEITLVVFGLEEASTLLGAVTLEEIGLAVDTVHRRLIPAPEFLL